MADITGLHFVKAARPGKPIRWYVYAWRGEGAPCIMKAEGPRRPKLGKAELAALKEAQDGLTAPRDSGLTSGVIRMWRGNTLAKASPEWKRLAPSTRETWGYALDAIEAKWGELPLAIWNDARMVTKVIAWRDSRQDEPRGADIGVQVLSELLAFAKLRALVGINVAADIPTIYEGADRAVIVWLPADDQAFCESAMALNRIEVIDALDLACLTGMRRGDLVAVTLDEVTEHAIVRTALKRSRGRRRRAVVPLIEESRRLVAELRARPRQPGVRNLLVNSLGLPWTPGSLTQAFNEVRDAANGGKGIVHPGNPELGEPDRKKHLHDCRGTFVTKLCRTPATNDEIARITAWSPENVERIRRTYVDDAAVVVALSERINRAL
jgi:integrase